MLFAARCVSYPFIDNLIMYLIFHLIVRYKTIHYISNPMYECRPNTRSGPQSKRASSPRLGRRGASRVSMPPVLPPPTVTAWRPDLRRVRPSEPGRVWRRPRPAPRDRPPSPAPRGWIRPVAGRGCSWLVGPSPCPNWKSSRSQHLMMMMLMGSRRIGRIEKTALRVVVRLRLMVAMLEEETSLRGRVG